MCHYFIYPYVIACTSEEADKDSVGFHTIKHSHRWYTISDIIQNWFMIQHWSRKPYTFIEK